MSTDIATDRADPARATVLVVEDEAHLAAGLKLNLELDGYRVVIARSLREAAAQLLQAAPIDLILLDVMLPDGESYGFCKQLRESGQYMPVIMLTARSAAEERVRGLDSGADDYMPKPFVLPNCWPACALPCAAAAGASRTCRPKIRAARCASARHRSTSIPMKPPPTASRCG